MSWVPIVQFMVQTSGSQPPVDEQKAAMFPLGSMTGASQSCRWCQCPSSGYQARLNVASTDSAHHIVAAARGHGYA